MHLFAGAKRRGRCIGEMNVLVDLIVSYPERSIRAVVIIIVFVIIVIDSFDLFWTNRKGS